MIVRGSIMLTRLTVKNFALLSKLELEFGNRLNILSGETGAGKSIIVDCIMLLTGGRYDKTMLRYGENSGFVEGVFSIPEKLKGNFSDYLDDGEDELIIMRKFGADGKNEARVNGRSVTVTMLREISACLVDICGQNEHQSLANVSNHIRIVDYYARHNIDILLKKVSEQYTLLRNVTEKLNEIGDEKTRARNLDVYKFQLDEIERAKLKLGEEDELIALRKKFLGAERICSLLGEARSFLSGDADGASAVDLMVSAEKSVSSLAGYDGRYGEWAERLKSLAIEAEDLAESLADELESMDFSADELEAIEKRLDVIRNVTRKYGSYEAVMDARAELIGKIDEIENAEENYVCLTRQKNDVLRGLYSDCVALSEVRRAAAAELERSVVNELAELGMADSEFKVKFSEMPSFGMCEKMVSANGFDEAEFYLSPNAGQPLKPLVKIISGGELSRLMLALKVVSSSIDDTPTVVFDEIDTGISGKVGQEIAKKLARLSTKHQLLCVTHLPQIAAMADSHFFIDKYADSGQTFTRVVALDSRASVEEVARLSGGKDISSQASENAAQMKRWSENYKRSIVD